MTSTAEEAAELAAQVAGVLLPADDGYVAECAIYNLNLVLEPALIVGVTSEADRALALRRPTAATRRL